MTAFDRTQLPIHLPTPDILAAQTLQEQAVPFPTPGRVTAPAAAPNVLVILIDDMGFGASSAFGGPCQMPTAEALAGDGLRFNRFHTTAICSPTRASLLNGRNHHSVGMGMVPEVATSSPGYTGARPLDAAPLARTLRDNGYATAAFGKWHQTPADEITGAGPYTHWPTNEGFERFYGFVSALEDQFHPVLHDGTTPVEPPATPEQGYHLSEDLVDRTAAWVEQVRLADPDRPWFSYLAFGATHSPFQVPDAWLDRYRGEFDHGWDEQRDATLARQRATGVVPQDAELSDWPSEVPHWDALSDTERTVAARLMEIYAAFAEHTDAQVGRLIESLRASGELENTLVFYILGDNGASPEGRLVGTFNEHRTFSGLPETAEEILANLDKAGTKESYVNYPVGWALAMDTPFPWTKQVASHLGGTRNGLVVHWPAGIADAERGAVRDQWSHVIDIAPTVLEAAGLPEPTHVDGIAQRPIEGTSMLYALLDGTAADRHTTQYFEILGNRGVYHEGWTAVTRHRLPWLYQQDLVAFDDDVWELYDLDSDFSQAVNLAEKFPEKLAELQEVFLAEARKYQVLPLDDRNIGFRSGAYAPDLRTRVRLPGTTRHLPGRAVPRLVGTSFTLAARIDAPTEASDGVLISSGDAMHGWSLYLRAGVPVFVNNQATAQIDVVRGAVPVTAGAHVVEYRFEQGDIPFGPGTGRLFIDGVEVGSAPMGRLAVSGHRYTVGANPGTPVTPDYLRGDEYRYDGTVHDVTVLLHESAVERTFAEELAEALQTH